MKLLFPTNFAAKGLAATLFAASLTPPATGIEFPANAPRLATVEPIELEQPAALVEAGETEVIRERYASGEVRIERQVRLDAEMNYVNHGPWKMFDRKGAVIASGQYEHGKRTGVWMRTHTRATSRTLAGNPFARFSAPFISTANFKDGVMDGHWMIIDSQDRKVMQVSMRGGDRHGATLMWLPSGDVLRQSTYERGIPVGEVLELKRTGKDPERVAVYLDGRKVVSKATNHPRSRQKELEESYLAARTVPKARDSFWDLTFAQYEQVGEEMRHGSSKEWYANGQPKSEGQYRYGEKVGRFVYWHPNGQKKAEGEYRGDQYDGRWVWWHENGQKSAIGAYQLGAQAGKWLWWQADGRLQKEQSFTEGVRNVKRPALELNR